MIRKLFIIFILLLIPLQVTWASVVTYCQHGSSLAVNHAGHHDVASTSVATDEVGRVATEPASSVHSDCGACHIACLVAQVGPTYQFEQAAIESHASRYTLRTSSAPPQRVERPQWLHLA